MAVTELELNEFEERLTRGFVNAMKDFRASHKPEVSVPVVVPTPPVAYVGDERVRRVHRDVMDYEVAVNTLRKTISTFSSGAIDATSLVIEVRHLVDQSDDLVDILLEDYPLPQRVEERPVAPKADEFLEGVRDDVNKAAVPNLQDLFDASKTRGLR